MAIAPSKELGAHALSPWGKALAGAIAAMLANTIVYPLDLVKTRLQVQDKHALAAGESKIYYEGTLDVIKKVYVKGGWKALYNGLGGSLLGTISTNFAYFYWYSLLRTLYVGRYSKGKALTTATELSLGALAAAVAQLFTIPVSVVTTRQQTEEETFVATGKEIFREDGLSGFWRGLKASLILAVNPSITYGSSARLQALFFGNKVNLSLAENFILGAASKSLATIATQPLIVAKVMQQSSRKYKSFFDALAHLIKIDGFTALFRGIGPQLSKGILVQGLLLAFKGKVESYIIMLIIAMGRRSSASLPLAFKI